MGKAFFPPSEKRDPDCQQGEVYYSAFRIRRGLSYYLFGRGITFFAAVLVPLLLVRVLTVSEYAGYTAFSGLLIMLGELSDFGLSRVVPRYLPGLRNSGAEAELRHICRRLLLLKALLLAVFLGVVIVFYPLIAGWFKLPLEMRLVWSFAVYAFSFNLSGFVAVNLQSLMLQKQLIIAMALEWYSKLLILCAALFFIGDIDLSGALLLQGGTAALGLLYMLWQLEKHFFSRRNQVVCPKKIILDWRQMVKTGAHNYFWDLTGIYSKPATIKLVSAFFFSYGVTAALGFAYALAAVVQRYMPSVLLNQIIEPTIIAKYTENHDFRRSAHYFSIVFKANLLILIPLTCWFYFYGDIVVNLISNGKYHHITWIISWLLVNQMLQSLMGLLRQASNAVQKSELLSECNVRTLLLLLLPAAGLVYFFGLPGLLLSLSATFFHRNIYILQRLYGYGYHFLLDWQGMAKIMTAAVAALTVAAITTLLFENNVIVCFAGLGVGAIVYLGFTFIMKPFSLLERETINKLLGRELFA